MQRLLIFLLMLFTDIAIAQDSDYWQQEVNYKIEVSLDDSNHVLHGSVTIDYLNNSPDTLRYLIFHLWPNAYRNRGTALAKQLVRMGNTSMLYASAEDFGYIDSLAFSLDGLPCVWEYHPRYIDVCTIMLERPLFPGGSVQVDTPFRVQLPSGRISRLGHVGESYQITQWYPKPAVYDKQGWHPMPYLTQGEFYSEFGSFDVEITLPANYVVGATGDLQNEEEREILLERARKTSAWISDVEEKDYEKGLDFPTSDSNQKTLRYVQQNVHDFAWFADKRYHVLHGHAVLPHSGDSVDIWTMFTNRQSRLWAKSLEYVRDAVYYYSLWNGDYPYHQVTAVDGTISAGVGMEYPNITVIGFAQDALTLETVIMHEVGHNWYYGILGSNERRFAWMDEGLNSYNERRYLATKYPSSKLLVGNSKSNFPDKFGFNLYGAEDLHHFYYLTSARANADQALNLSAEDYGTINYGTMVYSKTALWFDYLRNYLGDDLMDSAMREYNREFQFKHPYPEDLETILTEVSGSSLDWLFRDGLETRKKLDFAIAKAKNDDEGTTVSIINKGDISGPVPLTYYKDGKVLKSMWLEGFTGKQSITIDESADRVEIDPSWTLPEIKRSNNQSRTSGLFKRIEPLELSFLGRIEDPQKTQLHWLPLCGATVPGGFMPGIALYNSLIPVKKFNFIIAPMLALRTFTPVGLAEAYYMFTPTTSVFQSIEPGIAASRFTRAFDWSGVRDLTLNFMRIEPYLRFSIRPRSYSGFWRSGFKLSTVLVGEDEAKEVVETGKYVRKGTWSVYNRASYKVSYNHPMFKTDFHLFGEQHSDFIRSSLEIVNNFIPADFFRLRSRLFCGGFISNFSENDRFDYRMDGQGPLYDYTYDEVYLDRSASDEFLKHQFNENHGAFKIPIDVGSSDAGLVAYNAEAFVYKIPFGLFTDVGLSFAGEGLAVAGLCLAPRNHFFGIYLPLVYSNKIQQELSAGNKRMTDLIRFQVSFDLANPMYFRKTMRF